MWAKLYAPVSKFVIYAFLSAHTKFSAFITKCTIPQNIVAMPPHYLAYMHERVVVIAFVCQSLGVSLNMGFSESLCFGP